MQYIIYEESSRGIKDLGWLKSNFYFSFSDYYQPDKAAFGTLVAFNNDFVQAGKGFGLHPHVNMEIISVLLKGKMNHMDSMGYSTTIDEGGVQIMSAGRGLKHEEYNVGEEEVNFLQIWIQSKQQNIEPRYQHRSFPLAKRKNKLQTIVSSEEGLHHCWINQNAKLSLGFYEEPSEISYSFNPVNKCLFIYIIEGELSVEAHLLTARNAIGIWDTGLVNLKPEAGCQFLIIETPVNQK